VNLTQNKELIPNTTLSHYRIVSKLGAGGMGEVYLAQDTKLDRKVALKILPADIASHRDRMERFVREAKSAAALNHPNIATIHEIGESHGTHFIAMEFIDGVTLREKIHEEQTSLPKLLKYLTQVAEGLNKAHAAGIVHRDLKPDNIMITRDDYAKVLDFGLAKLVEPQKSFGSGGSGSSEIATMMMQQQSIAGMVMGTIGYMSPEQASGRVHEIDHRSDVFSFGCILFEAATGKKAFEGKDALDSLHKIVHAPTPLLKDINPLAPDDLQRVVRRCLAKEPDKRYQSMKEVAIEIDDLHQELKTQPAPFLSTPTPSPVKVTTSGPQSSDGGFWVAVLPFKSSSSNLELTTLAEGLSDEIVTGLSRFSYLRVVARSSTSRFSREATDIRIVGRELGARYVIEGTLRQAGSVVRVSVQLVDTSTGTHLWAENYNRTFTPEALFDLQDELVPRIVSTVADWYGVLPHSMSESVRLKPPDQLSPYEALLRSFGYFENIAPEEHALVRSGLERAVVQEPGNADLWAMLSMLFGEEHRFGFNVKPDSLGRSLKAARRAVEIAHANHFAWLALAQALFFRKEFDPFRDAAERAISLNPMDGSTVEYLGHLIAFSGNWERGCELAERARQLNPNHPSWYWSVSFLDAYRKGDYVSARDFLLKGNPQKNWLMHALLAAAQGQLGESEAAARHLREVLEMMPNFPLIGRSEFSKWYLPDLVDHLMDGIRKAGLETADESQLSKSSSSLVSSQTRADEGFWVAVLPFKFTGSNTEVATLAEGISEEIVTGLSRFSYLRVISRSSTLRYAKETDDVRDVGKTLGARYVMEGSLRVAGSSLRISVQLIDASTGAHLWAETYDRQFRAEEVFALQDDLVPRIVSTIADVNGVLPRSMSEVVCARNPDELSPYEAVLRSFRYFDRVTAEELAAARSCLEIAVQKAPANADAWAMLALLFAQDYGQGFNLYSDALNSATMAAQRAVEAGPSNHLAHFSLAQARFFQKDLQGFRNAAERGVALNPMDANSLAFMGELLTYVGDSERGLALASRAKQFNPNHPGWFWYADFFNAYRQGDYRGALDLILKTNLPGHWGMHAGIAAAAGQLGDHKTAGKAIRDLLKLRPDYGATVHNTLAKWFDPELCEQLLDGLRKAGLEIAGEEEAAPPVSSETRADEGFWVAVLPFKSSGTTLELKTVAEGLSEEIVTGLSRFSYLRVIARGSTVKYSNESGDVREIGRQLGARYVMEGSIRQAGTTIRLGVQLVDATTGAHLWADTYDRQFQPDQIFAVQDELVPRIVSTCADHFGVLARSISDAVRGKEISKLTPYEALMRGFGYHYRLSSEEHAEARQILEKAVEEAPSNADCWAMLSWTYSHEYGHGFNPQPRSLDRALAAARRAVELAPSNHLAYQTLAVALFFRKDKAGCLSAAERAMALNPLDASNEAIFLITFLGDWERGCSLIRRAMDLNPYVPGWYRLILALNEYRKANYREALDEAIKANVRGTWSDLVLSAIYGQLGEQAAARSGVQNLIAENFGESAREMLGKWFDAELVEHVVDGLRKAGLEVFDRDGSESNLQPESSVAESKLKPQLLTPSIAVLPFVNLSSDPDNDYFCDGLAEELLNALSKIDKLKVAARTSAFSFKGRNVNVSEIARTLKVNTVLEGSVRKSVNRVRITAQLVNAADGYHLWSERYDREMKDIFDVQDEITVAVVEALKVKLLGDEQTAVLKRHTRNPEALEFYLRGLSFFTRFTPEFFQKAIESFEHAIAIDPDYASAYAGLAESYSEMSFFASSREWMPKAKEAARKAIKLDDMLGNAHNSLAVTMMYYDRDFAGAENEFKRAITLDPGSAHIQMWYGWYLGLTRRFDESLEQMKRARGLDPLSHLIGFGIGAVYLWSGQPERAIEQLDRVVELNPNFPLTYSYLAEAYLEKGDFAAAIATIENAPITLNDPFSLSAAALAYARAGKRNKALEILNELEGPASQEHGLAVQIAQIYVGLGDNRRAFAWLEKACDDRSLWLIWLGVDPTFDPLRSDPRFEDLLRRVGLPHSFDNYR
jgi:TolB-like protein/Tfp pilus assembly protein PilF/predicted Ser/Thr protein kinase